MVDKGIGKGGKSGIVLFLEKPVVRPLKSNLALDSNGAARASEMTGPFSHTDSAETASKLAMIPIRDDEVFP